MLLAVLWSIVAVFARTQNQGTRLAEKSQLVRSLSQLLEDDLRAAIQDPIHPHKEPLAGDDDIRRFGLSGSAQSLRIDLIEIDPFTTPQPVSRPGAMGDIPSQTARVPELKTVFYEMQANGLSRREIDFETPDAVINAAETTMYAPEVVDCRFRYFNGFQWSDSWESLERNGLPVAIEATLRLVSLADANRLRREARGEQLDSALSRLDLTSPTSQRIVAYLPTSPVRKFEEFKRTPAPKKPEPPKIETPSTPNPKPPPPQPPPSGPQQSWIRGV